MFDWLKRAQAPEKAPDLAQEAQDPHNGSNPQSGAESPANEAVRVNSGIPEAPSELGLRRYPIQKDELFPWKGFMFRVTDVNEHGFSCVVVGMTRRLKERVESQAAAKAEALRRQAIRAQRERHVIP